MPVPKKNNKMGDRQGIRVTGACVRGRRHENSGQPCQDAYAIASGPDGVWGVAIADGLGSASHSDTGASIAVDIACKAVLQVRPVSPVNEVEELIRQAFTHAREAILAEAASKGIIPAAFASTLMVVLFSNEKISIGHIGDGIAVGIKDGRAEILSPPGWSEYANETACLVQPDWESQLRIAHHTQVEQCIIATDGCQGALATRNGGVYHPHEPFVRPLISFIRKKIECNGNPDPDIAALLTSERMQELSGDDKTLVVLLGNQYRPQTP